MNERCLHATGAGMCYHCAPWMFPTAEQEAATNRWFNDYRAWRAEKEAAVKVATTITRFTPEELRAIKRRLVHG